MKKIYSLLAMLLMASTIFAQTVSVTVNGNAVKDGETVDCKFDEIEKHPIPVLTMYVMEPHVVVKSSVDQEVSLEIQVLEKKGDDQIQNCFVNCITANTSNDFTVKETAKMGAGQEKDAQIHFNTKTNPAENPLDRHVLVKVTTASETLTFTLHMYWDPNGTLAISGVKADDNAAAAYSLSGLKLENDNIPSGSIYVKKGKKYIKK